MTLSPRQLTFDPERHEYRLDNVIVPSVTQVLRAVIPQYKASDWHLQRGTSVHMAAAYIARGVDIDFPEIIAGQVAACRKWFADTGAVPMHVEEQVCHPVMRYAGTCDLVAMIGKDQFIIDWKASVTPVCQWQLGAYEAAGKFGCKRGFAVQLNDDGTYQTGGPWMMDKAGREFAVIRSVYGLREREKLLPKEEDV